LSRYTVQGDYLCEYVDHCTCGVGRGGHYGAHEPGCGLEPVGPIAQLIAAQSPPEVPAGADVAELLAECDARDDRQGMPGLACIPVAEVRRLLAPGGADGTKAGT
jgi:hypothetical protein